VGQGLQGTAGRKSRSTRLNDIVTRAFRETSEAMAAHKTSMRTAAYGVAVRRVAEATITRGLYP
jgi:glutamate dehydrogenase/leucine dehydrogenase